MAEANLTERLQPSLLDRLTDDAPGDLKETRSSRVIDVARLREIVLRDLSWLLNTTNYEADRDLEGYPHAASSVINFGAPTAAGKSVVQVTTQEIEQRFRRAIEVFEPRINRETLEVRLDEKSVRDRNQFIAFEIKGHIWAQPMPLELYLRSELDLASGDVRLSDK